MDLKPANIMSGDFGEIFVIDWGTSKPIPQVGPSVYQPKVYFDQKIETLLQGKVNGAPLHGPRTVERNKPYKSYDVRIGHNIIEDFVSNFQSLY